MKRVILLLAMCLITLSGSLMFSSGRAIAGQYEPCNINNPNYCTECKDESKRDFSKCGEIDYLSVDLVKSRRIFIMEKSGLIWGTDYDPYAKKVVYCANIGMDKAKLEIFIADAYMTNEKQLVIEEKTKKRITWDSVGDYASNFCPLWTKERKIICGRSEGSDKMQSSSYIIDSDGNNKKQITADEYAKFSKECHERHDKYLDVSCQP